MLKNIKFGESLHLLLSVLDISSNRLSKAINVDSSLVNRWINEKRTPSYKNALYIESISEYLFKSIRNSFQVQHLNELFLSICGEDENEIDIKDKIKKILLQSQGYSIECKKEEIKENKPSLNRKRQIFEFKNYHQHGLEEDKCSINDNHSKTTYCTTSSTSLSSEDKVIIGAKNILCASISLFEAAADRKCNNNSTIYMTYNSEEYIASHYNNGLVQLRNTILKAINNGWNVICLLRLSNNVNRTIRFIDFIHPIITTGKFNLHYYTRYDISTMGKEYIIIPEVGALFCFPSKLHSNIDRAFYFKNTVAIDIFKDHFKIFLESLAQPLVKYYTQDNIVGYNQCIAENEESIGNRFMYKYDFSVLTLPENLYRKLLKKNFPMIEC